MYATVLCAAAHVSFYIATATIYAAMSCVAAYRTVALCCTVSANVYATVLCVVACCTVASCCTVAGTMYTTVLQYRPEVTLHS